MLTETITDTFDKVSNLQTKFTELDNKINILFDAVNTLTEKQDRTNELLEEIIEKLNNFNLPGRDYDTEEY